MTSFCLESGVALKHRVKAERWLVWQRHIFAPGVSQNQLDVAGPKFETPVNLQDEIHQTSRTFKKKVACDSLV